MISRRHALRRARRFVGARMAEGRSVWDLIADYHEGCARAGITQQPVLSTDMLIDGYADLMQYTPLVDQISAERAA